MFLIGKYTEDIAEDAVVESKIEYLVEASKEIISHINNEKNLKIIYDKYTLTPIDEDAFINHKVLEIGHTFGKVEIFEEILEFYLKIDYLDRVVFLKLKEDESVSDLKTLGLILFLDIGILILIYIVVLKILAPIKNISKEIENFSEGDFSTRVQTKTKDEVADLANSFNNMASTIENFIKTREELLRDVGHEFKTPIAKGKFALENLEESESKEIIKKSFSTLENLTEQIIEIEKLNYKDLEKSEFTFETLFLESVSSLILNEDSLDLKIKSEKKINGDLYYLSVALKNLIENGMKYSDDSFVEVVYTGESIVIKNSGEPLTKAIEYYLKPFTRESKERDKKGFGLGLSIVAKILEKHKFQLNYSYENGKNIFAIEPI